jgi:hypothetical protein
MGASGPMAARCSRILPRSPWKFSQGGARQCDKRMREIFHSAFWGNSSDFRMDGRAAWCYFLDGNYPSQLCPS